MEPFKNIYNLAFVSRLGEGLRKVEPGFELEGFLAEVFDGDWERRELKDRMRHISRVMGKFLPEDYPAAIRIVREVSPVLDGDSFAALVLPDFVEVYGQGHWEESMAAMEHLTQQSSAEFAIRPFLIQDLTRGMAQMLSWAGHENEHVRRLSSEGCRPRLPWGMGIPALKRDPGPILPVLERLKEDESEYVRRSVANNLNDITKDHPELVLEVLGDWNRVETKEMGKLVRHALRGLLKKGDPGALALVGLGATECVVEGLRVLDSRPSRVGPPLVKVGGEVAFEFEVVNRGSSEVALMVDYVVGFVLARGKVGKKVFKLSKFRLGAGERRLIRKAHSFRPITTRVYYPGVHSLAVQVNGVLLGEVSFELIESD